MKKILLLILLAMPFVTSMTQAATQNALVVQTKSGSATTFFLKDEPQVSFEGTNLKVASAQGNAYFPLADVLRFTYRQVDPTGIDEQVMPETGVSFDGGVLVISQLKAGATVSVYTHDGKLVRHLAPQRYGTYRLNLSELSSGLYVVKADNATYKITKP
jgi:hypothetical protein